MKKGEGEVDKTKCVPVMRGKNWKVFENYLRFNPICVKQVIFAIGMSCEQVAKIPWQNFWKICLKWFSRLRSPPTSKSWIILCKLATGAFTHKQVAKLSREKCQKPRKFWKFSKYISRQGDWLGRESWELLSKLATKVSWLAWLARGSCQNKVSQILIFLNNFKTKSTFQKQLKILKNLFVFEQHMIEFYNTFNQVQSHKWIRHSLNIDMCDVCGYQMWDSP